MAITVRALYFAAVADVTGRAEEALPLPEDATVAGARAAVIARYPALDGPLDRVRVARNERFAEDDAPLADGDRVAFIPPVSGG